MLKAILSKLWATYAQSHWTGFCSLECLKEKKDMALLDRSQLGSKAAFHYWPLVAPFLLQTVGLTQQTPLTLPHCIWTAWDITKSSLSLGKGPHQFKYARKLAAGLQRQYFIMHSQNYGVCRIYKIGWLHAVDSNTSSQHINRGVAEAGTLLIFSFCSGTQITPLTNIW